MSVLGGVASGIASGLTGGAAGLAINGAGNAITGIANSAFDTMVTQVAGWLNDLVGGLFQHILDTSGTAAQVTGAGFSQLYAAMIVPAMVLSVIVLVLGVGMAAIQGRAGEIIKRALVVPIAVVIVVGLAAAFTNDSLRLVDWMDSTYSGMALGSGGLSSALSKIGRGTSGSSLSIAGVSSPGASELLQVVVMFFMLLATLAVFIEMQVRTLIIWLMVALVPLGAAGLFWSGTERWMKRVGETLVAAILTPFPITVILSVGVKMGMDTNSLSKVIIALVALGLAAFSLPMMMKLVPIAEMAALSGVGSQMASKVRGHAGTAGRSAASRALSEGGPRAQRLGGQIQAEGLGKTALVAGGGAAGGAAVWAVSKSIGFAKDRLRERAGHTAEPEGAGNGTGRGGPTTPGDRSPRADSRGEHVPAGAFGAAPSEGTSGAAPGGGSLAGTRGPVPRPGGAGAAAGTGTSSGDTRRSSPSVPPDPSPGQAGPAVPTPSSPTPSPKPAAVPPTQPPEPTADGTQGSFPFDTPGPAEPGGRPGPPSTPSAPSTPSTPSAPPPPAPPPTVPGPPPTRPIDG